MVHTSRQLHGLNVSDQLTGLEAYVLGKILIQTRFTGGGNHGQILSWQGDGQRVQRKIAVKKRYPPRYGIWMIKGFLERRI